MTAAALMIGVALVGFITIFAASAKQSFLGAIDTQIKSDYVVNSGGSFGGDRPQPEARPRRSRSCPRSQPSTPVRVGVAEVNKNVDLITAVDPAAAQQLFDLKPVAGSLADLGTDGIAVSKKSADAHHWKIGTDDPGQVRQDRDRRSCSVEMIYDVKQIVLPGDYIISLADLREELHPAARRLDLRQAEARRLGRRRAARRSSRCSTAYPTAKLQDNAQYKADQTKNLNQILGPHLRAVDLRGDHRVHRHREHARAVDLRAHAGDRAAARGRDGPAPGALDDPVGVGDHRAARHAARARDRRCSSAGAWSRRCTTRASRPSIPRSARSSSIVLFAALSGVVAAIFPARRAAKLDMLRSISSE